MRPPAPAPEAMQPEASEIAEAPLPDAAPPPLVLELGETAAPDRMSPGLVRAIVRGRRDPLLACYRASGASRPLTVGVAFTVGERALARSVRVVRRSGSRRFDRCVTGLFKRISFGMVDGGRGRQVFTVRPP